MPEVCLGFDFGLRRIGVALGNTASGHASPLSTIHNPASGRIAWDRVTDLIQTWAPSRLIVGLPGDEHGNDGPFSERARRFARQLHGRYHKPVVLVPEHLSTVEAERAQGALDCGLDSLAAAVILQAWLDSPSTEDLHL